MDHPVCVEVCPCRALELVEVEEFEKILQSRRQEVSQKIIKNKDRGLLLLDLE